MQAHIVTIGDEILIGQIVDTNSAYIAQRLNNIGIEVSQISSISDSEQAIINTLASAKAESAIVILTGGLGPTKDDITKHTFCKYFEDTLTEDLSVLENIERLFRDYVKRPMLPSNRGQAMVPSKAHVLMNKLGTAPGMWMEQDETVFISLPGVPYEMIGLMEDEVLPRLQQKFNRPFILHKTIQTYGKGESELAKTLEDWENNLPATIKLAYLPALGKVRLRLSTKGWDKAILEKAIEEQVEQLETLIGTYIVGYDDSESIEAVIGKLLIAKGQTLAVAESCTGGGLSSAITSIPGASGYYKGGVVTYVSQAKIKMLGVLPETIQEFSVVSEEVALQMAMGVKEKYNSDYAIATTGNAGPLKGESNAEIGTVYIGIVTPTQKYALKFMMGNHRERVVSKTINKALELLRKEITKK